MPSAFVLSLAEIENELRKHGSGFDGGKQRIMALYQTQPDRNLRVKALAKEYGIGGHSHDYLDGSRGFVNHDGRGMEFDHYPEHKKFTLSWTQVEKYIDLMVQSDRYLTDREKEHYTPPAPVSVKPDGAIDRAKKLIREFCQEEYDSEPDFSDLTKIGIAYTHATDEDIPIQVNVDLVGYRVERYLGEVLIDERQYESLEDLTETELEALDFSELVSVTDEELEHYHSKVEERPALLPLDAATEYNALKEQHPDALVGFEQNGQFEFYADDAQKVSERLGGKLLEKETALGTVPVIGFPRDQWAYRAKQLWQCGENIYLAGLNEDGTHHQTKYLRREDYLPLGITIHMEGRTFRVDTVNFDKDSVTLQDVALAEMRMPIFREEPLALVRELYEQEQEVMEHPLPDYKVGDNVIVDLPTRTIEGTIGYVGETDVRIDTSAQGQSWDNEVINKRQFEDGLRQNEQVTTQPDDTVKTVAIYPAEENRMPYDIVIQTIGSKSPTLDAFIVATHTDREHIHNHIIYNSTALDSIRKFRDFLLSGLAVQRLSDLICLEHQLSVIEIKPYRERQKRTLYPPKESNRDRLCGVIDTVLAEKPKDYEDFLQGLEQQGYEVKRGKYTSVKGARQKRFIRFRTLGAGYSEEELKAVISGEAEHHPRQKQKRIVPEQKFQMLVDIQAKLAEGKSMGYARWAKRYNLKEMSKTLIFLQEHKIGSIKEMQERVDAATARYHELGDSIKAAEARMTEIAVLRTHIVNYARTRPVYDAYRKSGYSKRFLEAHREEITLHKAAKAAFDEAGLKKLPKTKDLSIEYAELLKKKKEAYPDYRKAQDEMQELMKAQKNVEMFFAEEKDTAEKEPTR